MTFLDPNVNWEAIAALKDQIVKLYPTMAWMLDVPDLAKIVIDAGINQWDEGRILSALQATEWWKARNEAARAQEGLYRTDPATWEMNKSAIETQIKQFASVNGITLTADEAAYIAFQAYTKGWSSGEWQAQIVNQFMGVGGQGAAPVGSRLNQMAAEYAVPLSDATLRQWEQQILTGMADENTFRAYLQEQAKSLFPGLANAIDRGITVQQYVAPYAEIAVQELGINPADIDWRDPKWSAAIHKIDSSTGAPTSMSLADWTRELRTNSIYGFAETTRAKELASQLGTGLAQMFGRAA